MISAEAVGTVVIDYTYQPYEHGGRYAPSVPEHAEVHTYLLQSAHGEVPIPFGTTLFDVITDWLGGEDAVQEICCDESREGPEAVEREYCREDVEERLHRHNGYFESIAKAVNS